MSRDELLLWISKFDDGYGNIDDVQIEAFLGVINADCKAKTKDVRRLEIIDHRTDSLLGRVYSVRPCSIALSYQDCGATLKVFVTDPPIGTSPQG